MTINDDLEQQIREKLEKHGERLKNDDLSADELAILSREFFADAQKPNVNYAGGYDIKLRLTLQAQFFQGEAARKRAEQAAKRDKEHGEKIEKRDFWMEVGVIVLIGAEI